MGDDVGTYLTPPSTDETMGTYSSWELRASYTSGNSTTAESGNDTGGYNSTFTAGSGSGSYNAYGSPEGGLEPASEYQIDAYDSSQVVPEQRARGQPLEHAPCGCELRGADGHRDRDADV